MKSVRRFLRVSLVGVAAALVASAARAQEHQTFGIGGAAGLVNDVSPGVEYSGFKWGEANGWFDYKMEDRTLLRLMYGNMWTQQSQSGKTVATPTGGTQTLPEMDETIGYGTVSVSYLFWQGFFTSGLFAGIGAYWIRPGEVPDSAQAYTDQKQTVFGWNAGADGEFEVTKNIGIVIRLTYHNVAAHVHRQFVNADAGVVARF